MIFKFMRMIYMQNKDVWIVANNIFPSVTEQVNVILRNFGRN